MQSVGAVLIGPFEGSRWRGGCGEGLWDLNGRLRLAGHFFQGSARCRAPEAVERERSKGLFGGERRVALELFRHEDARRCVACESTAWGDRVDGVIVHVWSGPIATTRGRRSGGRHR